VDLSTFQKEMIITFPGDAKPCIQAIAKNRIKYGLVCPYCGFCSVEGDDYRRTG
jgi:hypothetical protein